MLPHLRLCRIGLFLFTALLTRLPVGLAAETERPNIVLVMADDMGWGQTGYYNHPVLKTPNLDAMAANGLRFDRFYAGGPVCSPTRATVLTGRTHERTGVMTHGYALRRQEPTIAQGLAKAGYATGHFGKWHLNGLRGPGVPVLEDDPHSPGEFGFQEWLSVTNFFDRDPILSRQGEFEEFAGDSSEIVVDEALKFIHKNAKAKKPFFTVIWYGTPHSPWRAAKDDAAQFDDLERNSKEHYGELVAMDRSIGTLRAGLKDAGIAENTLFWFCSDNGGLPRITPDTVGGLRGNKGSLYEGGLRVPGIVEWPAQITKARVTKVPACTMDIAPTLVDIVGLPSDTLLPTLDGISLKPMFEGTVLSRPQPIGFRYRDGSALTEGDYKILALPNKKKTRYALYNLKDDMKETQDLQASEPKVFADLKSKLDKWNASVDRSMAGKDYPEGRVDPSHPEPRYWIDLKAYQAYFDAWADRPEYKSWIQRARKKK
ncbi:sulfatase family protein [Thalassoroseus pseudoceratinae]|uniref:sulfatase family protein n=1 Tax=Thalassoroseus pseudoceratinae TaxID=2713176 RepID=UPI00141EE408|nr:sulfatase-like hydrolase/transferase [Thalassoroseus pseudoceratinae]